MMSNLCTPCGAHAPQKFGGQNFFPPFRVRGMVQNFAGNSPWKEIPKTGFNILGAPEKKFVGVEISPNFTIVRLFCPFLQNGVRYRQSKTDF